MNKTNNIPTLRFPEFKDNWEMKKLGEVAELTSSKRVYANDYVSMGIPFYRGKEITELKENKSPSDILYISENAYKNFKKTSGVPQINDLLITAVGTLGNILTIRNNNPFYFKDGNLIWLRKVNQISSFLEIVLYFNFKEIEKSAIGSSQKALTMIELRKLSLSFPTLAEQTKIANFLTAVDEKIQALKKKKSLLEKYKKGLMQKLFSQTLRFKDEHGKNFGDWEVKKLGNCLDYIQPTKYLVESTEYDDKYITPVLTAGKTFILGYTNEKQGIFQESLPVIIFDDFTTATQFVDFPFKAKSSAMKILVAKENINIKFIYEAMQITKYEIGGHERHWISKFTQIEISLPSLTEQTKIADFLTAIDEKIMNNKVQITKMEIWKKGLLQQIFV